uniref:Peptidase C1A papain C-terminal domain-containing protein n=1 Tax=Alexandrium catenella TaxID=2925 RepID=A0A7S1W1I0_ALECA
MTRLLLCVLLSVPFEALSSRAAISFAYRAFRDEFRSEGPPHRDPVPYAERLAIFEASKARVEALNARPHASWVAKINRFADFTEAELRALRGYQRVGGRWEGGRQAPSFSSFLESQPQRSVAESMDWREHLHHSTGKGFIRNQGACGSCWAVAAVGALEMHAEIAGATPALLSPEQLVDCVQNPRHCGGNGGCSGATAELAFKYVAEHGLVRMGDYAGKGDGKCVSPASPALRIQRFETLPVNELEPLLRAVAAKGPVVVSVEASGWSLYSEGVFADCGVDAEVNHAVLMVGYGTDAKLGKYYLIRNSWGPDWGEAGYIKLKRHDSDKGAEAGHCGTDYDPKAGVGCDNGSKTLPVCGMCGVLSDSSYPIDVSFSGAAGV